MDTPKNHYRTHTPAPWSLTETMDGKPCVQFAHMTSESQNGGHVSAISFPGPDGVANAEFIVRAVNAHDALVKALDDATYMLDEISKGRSFPADEFMDRLDKQLSVLASAKSGSALVISSEVGALQHQLLTAERSTDYLNGYQFAVDDVLRLRTALRLAKGSQS